MKNTLTKRISKIAMSAVAVGLLCSGLLSAAACNDDDKLNGKLGMHYFTVGEQYSHDQGTFIFTSVTASCGITVGGTEYDGYYLQINGEMDMDSFYIDTNKYEYIFNYLDWESEADGEIEEYLTLNSELSSALSSVELYIDGAPGGESAGSYCLVFEMTEDIYNKLYARKDTPTDASYGYDIELELDCLAYRRNSLSYIAYLAIGAAEIVYQ
ncbi:MAG: hypothetical protein LUF82_02525 [Clostridia bacterium]|nr:hypothetical protein [Clostridia bacterium]